MNQKTLNIILVFVVLAVLALFAYFLFFSPAGTNVFAPTPQGEGTTTAPVATTTLQYKNDTYGFTFDLPESWTGYSIVTNTWRGDSVDANGQFQSGTVSGPSISIRHPNWDYKIPRQDIPVYVFTIQQWNDMQSDKFHIGAAPINPSELARNTKYVFALPARYNFAFLPGYEEVDQLIKAGNLKAF